MLMNYGALNSLTLLKIKKNINGASDRAVLLICWNEFF